MDEREEINRFQANLKVLIFNTLDGYQSDCNVENRSRSHPAQANLLSSTTTRQGNSNNYPVSV